MLFVLAGALLLSASASPADEPALPNPGNMVEYREMIHETFLFLVRANTDGKAWGTGVYTDDSMLATAAVHAGALPYGVTGVVKVTMLPGRESYPGSTRHGVTTDSCGPWHGSYRVEPVPETLARPGAEPMERAGLGGTAFGAFLVPCALWLLFSATSRRAGVLYRAYFNVYIGVYSATALLFTLTSGGVYMPGPGRATSLLLFSFLVACVFIGVVGYLVSRSGFPVRVSRGAAMVSSMGAVGIAVFWISVFLLLGGPLARFVREEGIREAAREIPGTGVSRRATAGFHSVLLPLLLLLTGLINTLRVFSIRDRIAERLMDPDPKKLHAGYLLLGLFVLVMFVTCASETGLIR